MNQGLEIILKRMDSHPEEFQENHDVYTTANQKWEWFLRALKDRAYRMGVYESKNHAVPNIPPPLAHLSDEDCMTVYKKLMEVQGESFTQRVLKTMMAEPEPKANNVLVGSYGYASQQLGVQHEMSLQQAQQQMYEAARGRAIQNKINSKKWTG